jgi:transmembrane sensor
MSAPEPDEHALDEAAAEWLFEREEGLAPGRAEAFAAWCQRDPRHAQAVARMERTLALLDEMPAIRADVERHRPADRTQTATTPHPGAHVLTFPRLAWLAGLAAALVLGFFIWHERSTPAPVEARYAADAAAQRTLVLADGSVLDLNADSDVSVRFTADERRVTLAKGEAHFQVAHNAARPFIVTAGDVSVRAVGTAFNVRLATGAVDVLVVEGKVKLAREAEPASAAPTTASPLVQAGERVQLSREDRAATPKIEKIDAASIRALLTWENPLASFADVPLRDVVARFNRRNVTQLVLEDAELGDRKVGGTIALDQVEAFVRLLAQDGDVVVARRTMTEIGLRRAR